MRGHPPPRLPIQRSTSTPALITLPLSKEFGLDASIDFFAMNGYLMRCIEAQLHLVPTYIHHRQFDVRTDHNPFPRFRLNKSILPSYVNRSRSSDGFLRCPVRALCDFHGVDNNLHAVERPYSLLGALFEVIRCYLTA